MSIHYIEGDATSPVGDGNKVIAHICNDIGRWGRGFVLSLSKTWPNPERDYRAWYQGNPQPNPMDQPYPPFELGNVHMVRVQNDIWVANMIAQHGIIAKDGVQPIRYDALKACLMRLRDMLNGSSVHMPRIGCGLAGGKWSEIEPLILSALPDVEVFVYDFDTKDARTIPWKK